MIAMEHNQVLKTMFDAGLISRHAMKTIRGQILKLETFQERETYLKQIIYKKGKRVKAGETWR